MEDPDFAKQNNRDAAASPLAYLPSKLLKQGFNVPPRQTAAYRSGEDQLKGALVLPLHSTMVLRIGTRRSFLSKVRPIRIALPLSGRQGVSGARSEFMVACPLEGLVQSVASLQTTSAGLRINGRGPFIQGVTKGIICLP